MDLSLLAEKYFTHGNINLVLLLPTGAPDPDLAELEKIIASLGPVVPEAVVVEASKFHQRTLKSGAKLITLRDATLPLVHIRASVMGGLMAERPGQEGLASLTDRVMAMATKNMPSEDLSRYIEGLGAYVNSSSGRNSMGLSGTFMAVDWRSGLEVMSQLFAIPAFNTENLAETRAEALAALKIQEEQLTEITLKPLRKALFRDHPYRLTSLGLSEVVDKVNRDDLLAFHEQYFRPEYLTMVVAGDIEPDEVAEYLEKLLESWKPSGEGQKVNVPAAPAAITSPVRVKEVYDSAQTHMAVAFLTPGLGHQDQAALEVLESYLSGMGGILFNELRNKQSLAYVVDASFNPGLNVGAFSFYIAFDPQKSGQAASGVAKIINQIRTQEVSPEELTSAVRFLTGQNKISLQTLGRRSDEVLLNSLYSMGLDFHETHQKEIEAVTSEDILRVAQKYLDPNTSAMSIVGRENSLEEAIKNFK
jgi:zinc protease